MNSTTQRLEQWEAQGAAAKGSDPFVRCLAKIIRLQWKHRKDIHLYDDIWRTPDGRCINDEGLEWNQHWQRLKLDSTPQERPTCLRRFAGRLLCKPMSFIISWSLWSKKNKELLRDVNCVAEIVIAFGTIILLADAVGHIILAISK